MKLMLHSIDAWRDGEYGWQYNQTFRCEEVYIEEPTTRRILSALRKWGYLTEQSKGRVTVEDMGYDHACWEICARGTGEPLFCLEKGWS